MTWPQYQAPSTFISLIIEYNRAFFHLLEKVYHQAKKCMLHNETRRWALLDKCHLSNAGLPQAPAFVQHF